MDSGWRAWRNPNRDVAFLVVGQPGRPGVQNRTGGEQGGYLDSVSYSPRFGHAIRSPYRAAIAAARGTP